MQQGADRRPELVLELDGDRVIEPVGALGSRLACGKDADCEFPVRVIPVAAPVTAQQGGANAGHLEQQGQPAGFAKIIDQAVALGVDIRFDVVRDLAGPVAEADAPVKRRGPDPEWHAGPAQLDGLPEPDMMPVASVLANRFLEGEILTPPEHEQVADRCVFVGPVEQHATGDANAGPQGHRVGGSPAGIEHRIDNLLLGSDQADVERIAGNALGGDRRLGRVLQRRMMLVMPPERRQYHISR